MIPIDMRIYLIYIISAAMALTMALLTPNLVRADYNYLTEFNYGDVEGNSRHFTLVVKENTSIPITSPNATEQVNFPAWTFNGTVPGPTMRMTEGDHVFIRVINDVDNKHHHSLHMHSIHPPSMDGTFGPSGSIAPGDSFTYEFIAGPTGVYPYHCHVEPIVDHINRGLYGAMIIDPIGGRPQANEMVMMMNSYDLFLNDPLDPTFRPPSLDEAKQIMGVTNNTTMEPIIPTDGMTMNTVIESNTASQISNDNGDGGGGGDSNDDGDSGSNSNDNNDGSNDSGNANDNNNNDGGDSSGGSSSDNDGGSNSGSGNGDGGGSSTTGDSNTESSELETTANETAPEEDTADANAETETGPELEIERDNEFYTLNGRAFQYADNPIEIKVGQPQRIYLLSMTEFDPVNSFHLHSAMFNYTASGTENTPAITTDIVTLGQGDRGIIEFTPQYTGKMMFHAHINEFTALGWMGTIDVIG